MDLYRAAQWITAWAPLKDEGRSSYQIAVTTCEKCKRAWQEAHGELVAIDEVVREKAGCDAQHIGSVDPCCGAGPTANERHKPHRATQSVPPGTRRLVMRRHHGCCAVPGCQHANFVDVHHVQLRSEGGDHNPEHLVVLCGAHHTAVHDGRMLIDGSASVGFRFRHADGSPYGRVADPQAADDHAKAFFALTNMGYKQGEARHALEAVRRSQSHVGHDKPELALDSLIRRALHQLLPKSVRAA